jgi:hypothetical protein
MAVFICSRSIFSSRRAFSASGAAWQPEPANAATGDASSPWLLNMEAIT